MGLSNPSLVSYMAIRHSRREESVMLAREVASAMPFSDRLLVISHKGNRRDNLFLSIVG